jgi:hypothetical protein
MGKTVDVVGGLKLVRSLGPSVSAWERKRALRRAEIMKELRGSLVMKRGDEGRGTEVDRPLLEAIEGAISRSPITWSARWVAPAAVLVEVRDGEAAGVVTISGLQDIHAIEEAIVDVTITSRCHVAAKKVADGIEEVVDDVMESLDSAIEEAREEQEREDAEGRVEDADDHDQACDEWKDDHGPGVYR